MPNSSYSVADLVLDESFQAYVLKTEPDAVTHWTAWLARNPRRAADVQQAAELIGLLTGPKALRPLPDKEAELQRLLAQLPVDAPPPIGPSTGQRLPQPRQKPPVFRRRSRRLVFLLTLLILAGAGWYGYLRLQTPTFVVLKTTYGQKRHLSLPDGSTVTLNANSTLRYRPGGWSEGENRQVWIEGEAFFDVRKRRASGQPVKFTVQAGQLAVEVLGTQFNVFHRTERTRIVLQEGRIRLRSIGTSRSLEMTPGETVVYSPASQQLRRQQVDPQLYDAWRNNRLMFDNTPLSEVAETIRQTYGKTVTFAHPDLTHRRLTGTIPADNLDRLLKALSRVFSLRITERGNTLHIDSE